MSDPEEFEDFAKRFAELELSPWQQRLLDVLLASEGGRLSIGAPRRDGRKRQTVVMACALQEMRGQRWDVVARTEEETQSIRREARELAARLTRSATDLGPST